MYNAKSFTGQLVFFLGGCHVIDENTEEKILASLLEAIAQLPSCNKDTLAFIILHLQKLVFHQFSADCKKKKTNLVGFLYSLCTHICGLYIQFSIFSPLRVIQRSNKNKMPLESIACVFGPTIIGSVSTDPAVAVKDLKRQKAVSLWPYVFCGWDFILSWFLPYKVMERLLCISSDYWRQYLSSESDSSGQDSPRGGGYISGVSTPMFNSPSTPELMPSKFVF